MHWVERANFTKIRRLLEIFEQERHFEVLLTVKNLHDLSRHLSPYSVPIILRPLPSEVVEGEHFITSDLLSLIPGGCSPAKEADNKAAGWEFVISTQPTQPSSASEDSGPVPQAFRQVKEGCRLERPPLEIKDSRLAPRASKKKKGTLRRQKVVGVRAEDFIPWVLPISRRSPNWKEEEEEDEMFSLIHNFAARKRKRDANLKQVADVVPEVAEGSSQPCSDGGSDVQAIVISGSPEMGLKDQPALGNVTLAESRKASPVPATIQVVHPLEQADGQSDRAKYTRPKRRRPLHPDFMLVNLHLPHCGLVPPMEEVSVPGPENAQEIIDWWRPSNRGKSPTDHLHDLYPVMLWMLVTFWVGGQGEDYTISVPTDTIKEDP